MQTIEKSIEVEAAVQKVYNQWTQFEQFPEFMEGIEEVRQLDNSHLHWVAEVAGRKKEWDAEIIEQLPEERIAWRSTSGVPNAGIVGFHPKDAAHTVVTLQLNYEPEGVLEIAADAGGVLSHRVEGDLKRFRDFIQSQPHETGAWRGELRQSAGEEARSDYGSSGKSGLG